MSNILSIDDEPDVVEPLLFWLRNQGHRCVNVTTATEGLALLDEDTWDLLLLDMMLPDLTGAETCRRVRARFPDLPVMIVSARTDEYDRVVGFEAGADEYVVKPYSIRVSGLRISALLRRSSTEPERRAVRDGSLVLDLDAMTVHDGDDPLDLTLLEIRLLGCFLERAGKALDRATLQVAGWGDGYHISERAVDTNVKRLRIKLGSRGARLETVRGVGYRWNPSP